MVLITLLLACMKSPSILQSQTTEQWPTWMVLELEEDTNVPNVVSERLIGVAKDHNISLLLQDTPADFEASKIIKNGSAPLLILESRANSMRKLTDAFDGK